MNRIGVNLEEALQRERARRKHQNPENTLAAFKALLADDDAKDDRILQNIFNRKLLRSSTTRTRT